MIISCPACKRRYVVHPSAFYTDTRRVRCVGCNHTWSEKITAHGEHEDIIQDFQQDLGLHSPLKKKRKRGWIFFILVLFALVIGAFFTRQQIVDSFPQTAPLFKAIGFPAFSQSSSLELKNTSYEFLEAQGGKEFVLKGEIANLSPEVLPAPIARMTLKTKGKCGFRNLFYKYVKQEALQVERDDCTLIEWIAPLTHEPLHPGETKHFQVHHLLTKNHALLPITDVVVEF